MSSTHRLLKRQMSRYLDDIDIDLEECSAFLEAINRAYFQADEDRAILERALEISSQELLQVNSEMRAVFQAFPDLFFRLDPDGRILDYLAGNKEDLIMPPESFLRKKIQDIPVEDIGNSFSDAIKRVLKSKTVECLEYKLSFDGSEKVFEARLVSLMGNQVVAIIRNITDRKNQELELEQYREHLEKLVEKRTGELKEEIVERKKAEEDLHKYKDHLEDLVEERTADLKKANEQLQTEIAERMRIEEELTQKNRMLEEKTGELKDANTEIRRFAYIVSHDLRGPLVNLKGFSGELGYAVDSLQAIARETMHNMDEKNRKKLLKALDEDIPEAIEFINTSTTRMDKLINAILKLSRMGRRELNFEPVDMNKLVQEILDSLKHQIDTTRTTVNIEDLGTIMVDRTSMEQIMSNLLENAVKYLDKNRPGKLDIGRKNEGEFAVFSVKDNGQGIPKHEKDKVFELFGRAGKQDVPGEGMGLTYARTLVKRLGGKIWFDTTHGEGTVFSFSIRNEA